MEGMLTGVQDVFYSRPILSDEDDSEDEAARIAKARALARDAEERAERKALKKQAKEAKRLARAMKAAKAGMHGAAGGDEEGEGHDPVPSGITAVSAVPSQVTDMPPRMIDPGLRDDVVTGTQESVVMPTSAQRPRRERSSADDTDPGADASAVEDGTPLPKSRKSDKNKNKNKNRTKNKAEADDLVAEAQPASRVDDDDDATPQSAPQPAAPKRSKPKASTSAGGGLCEPTPHASSSTVPRNSLPHNNGFARLTKDEKEQLKRPTDDELKDRFKDPGAMERYVSSQWIQVSELKRLEAEGIIKIKRGPFTPAEVAAVKKHLQDLKTLYRMDDDELTNEILTRRRGKTKRENEQMARFWPDVASVVPGRPVRYVKAHVQRMYDPKGKKGSWTADEDDELLRAFERFPNEWSKIAELVDRSQEACRDRWRNELKFNQTRVSGRWSREEEQKLVDAIRETNEALGEDPLSPEAPWDEVAAKMGNTRTRTQCRKKWQDQLRLVKLNSGDHQSFPYELRRPLIERINDLQAASEAAIPWSEIGPLGGYDYPERTLKRIWAYMKKAVSAPPNLPLDLLLQAMAERLKTPASRASSQANTPVRQRKPSQKRSRPSAPSQAVDGEDELDDDDDDDDDNDEKERAQGRKRQRTWAAARSEKQAISREFIDSDSDLASGEEEEPEEPVESAEAVEPLESP